MNGPESVNTSFAEIMAVYRDLGTVAERHSAASVVGGALLVAHSGVTGRTLTPEEILEMVRDGSQWLFAWTSSRQKES